MTHVLDSGMPHVLYHVHASKAVTALSQTISDTLETASLQCG